MKLLTGSGLTRHKDYQYAIDEILHYSYTMELDGVSRYTLMLCLLEAATHVMGAINHQDYSVDLAQDPQELRDARLDNFAIFAIEFAQKRLALAHENDPFLDKRILKYRAVQTSLRLFEGREIPQGLKRSMPYHEACELVTELEEMLVMQGIARHPLARAFIDTAFTYAALHGRSLYLGLCRHMAEQDQDNLSLQAADLREILGADRDVPKLRTDHLTEVPESLAFMFENASMTVH